MSKYTLQSAQKIYLSMDGGRADDAGIAPESKHHPHVVIGPLSLGGAHACQDETLSTADRGLMLLVHGVVAIGGDYAVYPLHVEQASWPALTDTAALEALNTIYSSLRS